jgi:hypothetical protein
VPDRPAGDGLEQLSQRMERGRRAAPVPRRPATTEDSSPAVAAPGPAASPVPPVPSRPANTEDSRPAVAAAGPAAAGPPVPAPMLLPADEAQANLAVRVRRSLDRRLDDLAYELRRSGVRSSKAELVELLLWELPPTVTPELAARLARFRSVAARR